MLSMTDVPPETSATNPEAEDQLVRLQRALINSNPDLMWIKDPSGRFLVVNDALARIAGSSPAEMLGKTDYDFFPPEAADTYTANDRDIVRMGGTIRRTIAIRNAVTREARWYESIKTAIHDANGSLIGVAGVARDIHSQHEAEMNVELQHARVNALVSNVPGVVWEEYFDGSHRFVNDYVEAMVGYPREEYLEKFDSVIDLIPESDRAEFESTTASMIEQNRGWTHRFRLMHRNGSIIWCESHCSVIRGPDGMPTGLRGVSMDVTSQVHAEELLRQSEERFRTLADAAPVMIWKTNAAGESEFQNRGMLEFAGDIGLDGHNWMSIVHPDDAERVGKQISTAHAMHEFTPFEMRLRRHDGEWRDILVSASPQAEPDGSFGGYIGTCVDFTDHRQLERQAERNERMAGLGRLAATIAHEINNVLMAIQPYSEVIRKAPSPAVLDRVAERIAGAVQRGGRITHQILRYAQAAEPSVRELEVTSWLHANAEEWQTLLGSGVIMSIDAPENLYVLADADQLQQVFLNLATNSEQAMNGSGTFRITARAEERWSTLPPRADGFVHLIVEDTGPGIASSIAPRVFEPLFTTRAAGTGLGLAIVHDIVRKHGGAISIDGDQAGARFHIVLAAVRSTDDANRGWDEEWPEQVRRVLIVEDEIVVADALRYLLELFEVEVSMVHRGAEALDAIEACSPDLVILDVGLPDIPGTRVFEQIRAVHANLPVLFATGHNVEPQSSAGRGPVAHILKPFDATALIQIVRTLVQPSR
jgi:PAS domain S-box-containing protein